MTTTTELIKRITLTSDYSLNQGAAIAEMLSRHANTLAGIANKEVERLSFKTVLGGAPLADKDQAPTASDPVEWDRQLAQAAFLANKEVWLAKGVPEAEHIIDCIQDCISGMLTPLVDITDIGETTIPF